MSVQSDFKSSPFALFGVKGGLTSNDTSLATLVGVKFASTDSRVFALVQNAGTALAAGVLVQGPATIGANHTGLAVATAAATGATSIIVTLAAVATANQYAGGFAVVSAGTNAGLTLKIASHAAAAATAPLTLVLEDPLSGNLAVADSKVTLNLNPYGSANGTTVVTSGVIIAPSGTSTGQQVGVTLYPIAASTATVPSYGWIQTKGPIACLAAGTATAGLGAMLGAVNGAVSALVVATNSQIGRFITTAEDTKKQLIYIDL
jgi:hypothetical protein